MEISFLEALGILDATSKPIKSIWRSLLNLRSPLKKPILQLSINDWRKILTNFEKELPTKLIEKFPELTREEAQYTAKNCLSEFLGHLFVLKSNPERRDKYSSDLFRNEPIKNEKLSDEEVKQIAHRLIEIYKEPSVEVKGEFIFRSLVEKLERIEDLIEEEPWREMNLSDLKSILKLEMVMISLTEGLSVFTNHYGYIKADDNLIAGLVTAMRNLLDEIYKAKPNRWDQVVFMEERREARGETFCIWSGVGTNAAVILAFRAKPEELYQSRLRTLTQKFNDIFSEVLNDPIARTAVKAYEPTDILSEKILGLNFLEPIRYYPEKDESPHENVSNLIKTIQSKLGENQGFFLISLVEDALSEEISLNTVLSVILDITRKGALQSTTGKRMSAKITDFEEKNHTTKVKARNGEEIIKQRIRIDLHDLEGLLLTVKEQKDFNFSRDMFETFIPIVKNTPDEIRIAYEYENQSIKNEDLGDYEIAFKSINQAETEIIQFNQNNKAWQFYYEDMSRLYLRKGIIHRVWGGMNPTKFEDAKKCFQIGLNHASKITNIKTREIFNLFFNVALADVYRVDSRPDLEKSQNHLMRAELFYNRLFLREENHNNEVRLAMGYYHDHLGLVQKQLYINNYEKDQDDRTYLEAAKSNFLCSLWNFLNLKHIKWISKSIIDLCGCFFLSDITSDEISFILDLIAFLEQKQIQNYFALQYIHNISLNKAKFLSLKGDSRSLEEAEEIIKHSISLTRKKSKIRETGSEMLMLGQILIQNGETKKGLKKIQKALKLAELFPQTRKIHEIELKRFLERLNNFLDLHESEYEEIKQQLFEFIKRSSLISS